MGSHVCISNDAELLEAVIRYPSSGPDQFYDTTYDLFFYVNVAYGLSGNFSLGLVHTFLVEDHDWSIFRVGYNCIYVSVFCQHVRCIYHTPYVLCYIAIS